MSIGTFSYPLPANEPVLNYGPGSAEKKRLKEVLAELKNEQADIPMYIGGREVRTEKKVAIHPPHENKHVLGYFHAGDATHVQQAIDAALGARESWAAMSWESRAGIFLKAADLIAGKYRPYMNGTTMLGQSKNAYQAEIDAACELIDFLRFNVHFLGEIYKQQPVSGPGMHNRMEYRPLEGFVLAVTPFNFTAIGGNLPTSAALCGNVVVWKPANTQVYSAQMFMRILREAGLPEGVINLVYVDGPTLGEVCFNHRDFAGVHFTGSTGVFNKMWETIGKNMSSYRTYPRIVGETGGKDFVLVHKSANADVVATALLRGAFEFQGQKCSAASRAYIPSNIAEDVKAKLVEGVKSFKVGTVEDFTNFVNAVIDEKSFDKIRQYIDDAAKDPNATILVGGDADKSKGYFIQPTVIETKNPQSVTMCEEIFGPVLTIYVYDENEFEQALELVDTTSPYALTGSIIATDRAAIERATVKLKQAAGNFYINDKPTGAVVGQQPFGGARASGTNDKAGSILNLYRWLSARTIKETFQPPVDYRYAFLQEQ
ncbi:MAG: 1-pyrroline-5-carboxylate dehydrogenase [Sphingobacteriales bacterium SCN 48-20]|uniref:L-glutamate gamma-semialdehyde dehydrogenase n=1 Tax=Terrimonas ferruginea TaxID=249 RepID=UPI00086CDC38|nr:L-glutamate gamma-semialdehyde dehydrogenase [Terrimonas ferruginea]MBN8782802.1 L-glutamate gamma-semialdehyde dehydrogenase [Terrimonas ferruginea]ODT93609.1 MAG: 1-pyrroline-5-carboxylate dehydrogenase [Sphingobacteriales bacterium SCN 48-20]OJW44001.1 MAG: 1-pyrroline-5-carboxylate dehydrogenase [Sphingobacteriales bacterium 48-107]